MDSQMQKWMDSLEIEIPSSLRWPVSAAYLYENVMPRTTAHYIAKAAEHSTLGNERRADKWRRLAGYGPPEQPRRWS